MDKDYSIIIPHKNIPDLLQRCLDSIPVRDDVEIIVVDDNSSPEKVDFDHFPGIERQDVEVIFTKEGKGAGYARNVGMSHATGKWLTFVDADDFLTEEFEQLIEEMRDAEEDIIFFKHRSVLSDDINTPAVRAQYSNNCIRDYLDGNPSEVNLRCRNSISTCKFIKRELVERNNIRYSETKYGNDSYFSTRVGCMAKTIRCSNIVGYVITARNGSLTSNFMSSQEEVRDRLGEAWKCCQFIKGWGVYPEEISVEYFESFLSIVYKRHRFIGCLKLSFSNIDNWGVSRALFCYSVKTLWQHRMRKLGLA